MSHLNKLIIVAALLAVIGVSAALWRSGNVVPTDKPVRVSSGTSQQSTPDTQAAAETNTDHETTLPDVVVMAEELTIPWDIAFLPDGSWLVTERAGMLQHINPDTSTATELTIDDVSHRGEGGLLGIVIHPQFAENHYLYIYHTSSAAGVSNNTVARYRFVDNELTDRTVIITDIPGSLYHNGGRMAFGPDGKLYIATGDATEPESAQDTDSLAGKILRLNDDGSIPSDNPFGNAIYSYGHRNPQGLTWDDAGNFWSTEHGRSGVLSGMDEINLIRPGENYGWPEYEGDETAAAVIAPAAHSGPDVTWAPASALWWDGSLFFTGLRGQTLYEAVLEGTEVVAVKSHFAEEFGRLRTVLLGPDGGFYVTTSNRDGRGRVRAGDDKIIRLNPEQFR